MQAKHLTTCYKKLLDRGAPVTFVHLLKNWYGNLCCRVHWNDVLEEPFVVKCGVRQGGVLSPYLFAIYIDDLIAQLKQSGHGIYIEQLFVGCVCYAVCFLLWVTKASLYMQFIWYIMGY